MTVAILAYGSLRSDPGPEIAAAVRGEPIIGQTKFAVGFARLSATRGMAPTLARVQSGGARTVASVLVLKDGIDATQAREMLVRRERHLAPGTPLTVQEAAVHWIRQVDRDGLDALFETEQTERLSEIDTCLYVDLPTERRDPFSARQLARRAIESVRRAGGQPAEGPPLDGITYLQQMISLGVPPELTKPYEDAILKRLGATDLAQARAVVAAQTAGTTLHDGPGEPPATENARAGAARTTATAPIGPAGSPGAADPIASPAAGGTSTGGDSLAPTLIRTAGAVATGIGIVGFVALVGGAYFWMRFNAAGLPADEAVADMAHTQLIVVGARVVIPFVGIALVEVVLFYLIERIVSGEFRAGPLSYVADHAAKSVAVDNLGFRLRLGGTVVVVVIALGVDFVTARRLTSGSVLVAIGVALVLVGAVALYAHSPKIDYLRFVLVFIAASAAFGVFWAVSQVTEAPDVRPAVAVVDGKPLAGLYVTSSSDQVYIAEVCAARRHSEVGRSTTGSLLDVPRSDVSLLLIGDNSGLEQAIRREQSLLESLPQLAKIPPAEIQAVAPPAPSSSGGAACTGPSAAHLAP